MTTFWDGARYFMAMLVLLSVPAALGTWIVIHSMPAFWRRLGPVATYAVMTLLAIGLGVWLYVNRALLLGEAWPFNWWLAAIGLALYGVAIWLEVQCRRHLKLRTLVGLPEIGKDPSRLLDEGIYSRVRHPRYLSFAFGVAGWTLIVNYPGLYVCLLAMLPLLLLVVRLEERELCERLGEEYVDYMARVPRFVPRRGDG